MLSGQQQGDTSSQQSLPWWVQTCRWLWKFMASLGTLVLLAFGVNVLSTWFTSSKGSIPADSPVGVLLAQWPLTLLASLCLFLLAGVTWLLSRWPVPATERVSLSPQARERILRRLRLQYEQMLAQSLQGAVQIELGLASRPAAIQHAASLALRLPDQPEQLLPEHTSIVQAYELAGQELLILGEPGAGKSTLLLELAHQLVEQAEADATQPLPMVLPLSSWATTRPTLQEWLIEQVTLLYDVPRRLSQHWIQAEVMLPLLDGLDEMEEGARPDCIAAINTYHREHPHPLVVCSRTTEYNMAARRERLLLQGAVVVQPLTSEQVDTHLATLGKPVAALRAALKKNSLLVELAATPLMLQILLLTYHGTPLRQLSQKAAELQQQIWEAFVERMVTRKGDSQRYSLERTCSWLGWLAKQMRDRNQTIFFLEFLQPDVLPNREKNRYRQGNRLFVGLLFGLLSGLLFGLGNGLTAGLTAGLIVGPLFGLVFGLVFRPEEKIKPAEMVIFSWKRLLSWRLPSGLLSGLLVGLLLWLTSEPTFEWVLGYEGGKPFFGPAVGVPFGPAVGLLLGLAGALERKQLPEWQIHTPNEGIKRSFKNGLVCLFLGGLFLGPAFVLLFGLLPSPTDQLVAVQILGLAMGLALALFVGLTFGLFAVVQHYTLRFWLWRRGVFPFQAVSFLEDATARILLRRVGGGYSFSHRLLLEYFADLDPLATASSQPPHPDTQHSST